ncbi:FAD:protein FMN transferase [Mucilaginibacter phyllosphaerae]|uniref:FAD:protein FMN transferase n=1 Tax=Mucilaginibacter phyllosphaerae TaxID=1812349 RepID=A0A4Y8AF52_9SPHI|nr:FAD:protein FMN transferase [Mucilaginibacter phyllosphaerae]MBB3970396.1 thiamine biosynthesis lipoprotein [Mucilaginibacter phyllosphaerae]TEW66762.1 FAD:protein FMN transferase [Mucilaginibacter phyllosphaerae]GGH11755.1 FAD:protein FMN transferase [Mucilaginibacter phyllosphaerae]
MLAVENLSGSSTIFNRETRLLGNRFGISIVANDAVWALARINSAFNEITRVEKLLSAFPEDSALNNINRNAGIKPVRVDAEIFRLVDRALQISALTYGTFDITYAAANNNATDDSANGPVTVIKKIRKKISLTNYTNVVLDFNAQTVFLKNKGMRIGFGAISRGYAADRAKYILQMEGVSSGVINAGGDLLTWGLQPDNTPWTIASADPAQANQPYAGINISNMAVATSYNSEAEPSLNKKVNSDIDPENGFPVSKIKSVSIITPGAELADAMASPVIAMGINAGLYLINKLNQMACIIIDDHARVYTSKDISVLL